MLESVAQFPGDGGVGRLVAVAIGQRLVARRRSAGRGHSSALTIVVANVVANGQPHPEGTLPVRQGDVRVVRVPDGPQHRLGVGRDDQPEERDVTRANRAGQRLLH